MYKKAMLCGLLGYVCGCIIGLCFTLRNEEFMIMVALPGILLGGIPGAIVAGTTVVYDIEKWSLLRATLTHFLLTMGVIFFASFVLNWFPLWSVPFWILLAAEAVGYAMIWLVMHLRYRARVRQLNELLEQNRQKQEKTD